MEIIKGPNDITCKICGTIFRYNTDDVYIRRWVLRNGDVECVRWVKCPICEKDYILEKTTE